MAGMRTVNPEQHARKRAEILAAAGEEFAAFGVDGATTAGICRRAGIGSGTLFHYFPTKRDIFQAMFAEALAGNARVCEQALLTASADEGLDLLVDHLVHDLGEPTAPGLSAAAILQANRDPAFATLLAVDEERTRTTLVALLGRLASDGRRLPFAPHRAAQWIITTIDAAYLSAAGSGDFEPTLLTTELRHLIAWLVGRTGQP